MLENSEIIKCEVSVPMIASVPVLVSVCFACTEIYIQSTYLTITDTLTINETYTLFRKINVFLWYKNKYFVFSFIEYLLFQIYW